jgi:GSH-dependent disulfide-bond oxidoreductase
VIKFYFNLAPNPMKVALLLEELGAPYEPLPVDTRKGEQHTDTFKRVNPNAKVPAIVDGGATIFDSNAILLYLADKHGKFVPAVGAPDRGPMLSWLMFIASGIGPFSGQAVHFRNVAPEPKAYALNRYDFEAHRHWQLIEDRLTQHRYMLGDTYGLLDMALWGWARAMPMVMGNPDWAKQYPHVKRHWDEVSARPAAQRVEALRAKFTFKNDMDDEAKRAMFPANERLAKAG